MLRRLILIASAAALLAPAARADVKPHPLFSDGLVLQRGANCAVWGTAAPGEKIAVEVGLPDKSAAGSDAADKDGHWLVRLPEMAPGGPYTMSISGNNKVTLKDVYVGEVWVASGQSNMEQALANTANAKEAIEASKDAKLRLFTVPHKVSAEPVHEVNGKWAECGPDTVKSFSAVAYYFGRDLRKHLDVPVGLIHASWGGTIAEAWTPRQALEANPALRSLAPAGAIQPGNPNQGTVLFNGMIAPLLPYAVRGAIWYQGESNAGRAYQYQTLFPTLIQSWREAWKNPDMPFLFVQLAPWMIPPPGNDRDRLDPLRACDPAPHESAWAELREAQRLTSLHVKNTGMAVITDVGDATDIHPRRKEPVGARLALAGRAIAYGDKAESSGPVYKSMEVDGNRVVLHFTHAGKGLEAKGGALVGFTVAGEDQKFSNALAEVKGDTVVVWSDRVSKPVAVRFGWANCPVVDFWNKDGLPASPFRTDEFPLITNPDKPRPR
jgi:sialate O-acetylesterase